MYNSTFLSIKDEHAFMNTERTDDKIMRNFLL